MKNNLKLTVCALLAALVAAGCAQNSPASSTGDDIDIAFTVSVEDPDSHYVDVLMDCGNVPEGTFTLRLPVWAPGFYIILDYPKNIIDFEAFSPDGKPLEWAKCEKTGWKISNGTCTDVTVRYRVWADGHSVAEASLSPDHLFLPGNGVFMHPEGGVNLPSEVKFVSRPEWKTMVTGLQRIDACGDPLCRTDATEDTLRYSAENFDILYDSPFFWGNPAVESFEHEGHRYDVSVQGEFSGLEAFCGDLKKIISAATELMDGEVPYDHYAFMFLGPGNGGLEHWNSQADFLSGIRLEDYKECLNFVAHEYYHLYNVKAIHPVELGPFDYYGECYTNCLWLSEGATVYYEYYLCEKAGLITRQQMLDFLARDFKVFESREGKNHMTLARSSYDIWLNFFNFAGNGGDTRISYYEKGPAVTFLFDCAIRIISGGERSFDDVMRLLYRRFVKELGRGFTEEELNDLIREVAAPVSSGGNALLDEVFSYIYTLAPIDYNRFLAPLGMHWDGDTYSLTLN